MKQSERRSHILYMLESSATVTIQQIVEATGGSEATIRRDVSYLESVGAVERCWGGVHRINTPENQRKRQLQNHHVQSSQSRIGLLAAQQLKDNELIFIGSGMTTLAMIPYITNKNIHVITNGIPQLEALHEKGIRALLLCGFFKSYSRSLVGKEAVDMLRGYRFDRAFLGVNGLDEQLNLLSADEHEDAIKTICIRQSHATYVLAEKSKFERTAFYSVPHEVAGNVTIITDEPIINERKWTKVQDCYLGKIGDLVDID